MSHLPEGYTSRPATLADVERIADLFNAIARSVSAHDTMPSSSFRMLLSAPGFDIASSTRLVTAADGTIAGFVELFDFEEPHTHIWGHALTAVDHRGRGIEEALHAWILHRSQETVPKAPAGERVFVEQVVSSKDAQAIAFLESKGYEHTRSYIRMAFDLAGPIAEPALPDGFAVAPIDPGRDLDEYLRAKVDAFRDHYGRGDLSDEQQVSFHRHLTLSNPDFDPSLHLAVRESASGEIVGICSAMPSDGIDTDAGGIPGVAVRRPWRRRGLATALLLHMFHTLKRRGKRAAVLRVDSRNPTGATGLYAKAGMREEDRNFEFQLTIRPARA